MTDGGKETVFVVVVMGFGLSCGLLAGNILTNEWQKKKAVEAGAAEYRCDPQSGNVEFHWLPASRKETD